MTANNETNTSNVAFTGATATCHHRKRTIKTSKNIESISFRGQFSEFCRTILKLSDKAGHCWASNETLAMMHNCSVRTITRWKAKAVDYGLMTVDDRFRNNRQQTSIIKYTEAGLNALKRLFHGVDKLASRLLKKVKTLSYKPIIKRKFEAFRKDVGIKRLLDRVKQYDDADYIVIRFIEYNKYTDRAFTNAHWMTWLDNFARNHRI